MDSQLLPLESVDFSSHFYLPLVGSVSCPNGDVDGPTHVTVEMTAAMARHLLGLMQLVEVAMAFDSPFYCVEFFYYSATWGHYLRAVDKGPNAWWVALGGTSNLAEVPVECATVRALQYGIEFVATTPHSLSGTYFESPLLSWETLRRLAASLRDS